MAITVTTSGEAPKFDIFDNGLALLALHSACLALAFTAIQNAKPVADAFNLTWMAAGFAFGAVLAVLAAYYGTINARALGPQLLGQPQSDERPDTLETISAAEGLSEGLEGPVKAPVTGRARWQDLGAPLMPIELRSRLIVTGVVLVLFMLVGVAIHKVADNVDSFNVSSAEAAAKKVEENAANVANAAETPAAKEARVKRAGDDAKLAASEENEVRRWRAWMMVGLAGLVLLPLPFSWSGPSQFLSAARGFLVLGSLLSFVLGVGVALLPLAANSVEEGVNRAVSENQRLPGVDRPAARDRAPPNAVTGGVIGDERADDRVDSPIQTPLQPGPYAAGVTPEQVSRLESRIDSLRDDLSRAAAAREIQVSLTDPRPPPQYNVPPTKVEIVEQTVDRWIVGEPGPVGPMWRCRFALSKPPLFRNCGPEAVPQVPQATAAGTAP